MADRASRDARLERVGWVLEAARRLADPGDALGREARQVLPSATGLSREGVELALAEHLETRASEADLASLLSSVRPAPRTHVVLSSNVFVAASRALALALCASPEALVRPSRREPAFARLLHRALDQAGHGEAVRLVEAIAPAPGERVHAYGRDESLRAISASLPEGVGFWAHGSGLGVAVVDEKAAGEGAAAMLARDVVPFDQQGCLSPRVVLFVGGEPAALAFAEALSSSLEAWASRVPLGAAGEGERAARTAYLETMRAVGEVNEGAWGAVAFDPAPRALVLPQGTRVVHLALAPSPQAARQLLSPLARLCACLGGEGEAAKALAATAPWARRSGLGFMQRPPLDGPVDRRAWR